MARRSAKRIVLDEITEKRCRALELWQECEECSGTIEITHYKNLVARARRQNDMMNEAAVIAKLLGADQDEIEKACEDGEKIFRTKPRIKTYTK